ncbi:hypothetical protein lerEdw1_011903 [Lerista edwardsae]|nr:hypothetical protein lerEdw1_011903 [Lerista edwardsae]
MNNQVIGEPESIDWYNPQGEKIVSSPRVVVQKEGVRSRLTIYSANVEDAGIYRCQATDARGQTQEATVVLEIYHRFAMLPNNNLQILKINKSDEGVYRCEGRVEARGEIDFRDIIVLVNGQQNFSFVEVVIPVIGELLKGKRIEENDKYLLRGSNTELTIRDIKNIDAGPYYCEAKNKAGKMTNQTFVQVFVQPQIIRLKNETTFENGQATLICEAEGEPIPEITWKRAIDGITFSEGDKTWRKVWYKFLIAKVPQATGAWIEYIYLKNVGNVVNVTSITQKEASISFSTLVAVVNNSLCSTKELSGEQAAAAVAIAAAAAAQLPLTPSSGQGWKGLLVANPLPVQLPQEQQQRRSFPGCRDSSREELPPLLFTLSEEGPGSKRKGRI